MRKPGRRKGAKAEGVFPGRWETQDYRKAWRERLRYD